MAALGYILIYIVAIAITIIRVMKVTVELCFNVSIMIVLIATCMLFF